MLGAKPDVRMGAKELLEGDRDQQGAGLDVPTKHVLPFYRLAKQQVDKMS